MKSVKKNGGTVYQVLFKHINNFLQNKPHLARKMKKMSF